MAGIDLLHSTGKRLRPEWFKRFLLDPYAFKPGTLMPKFYPDGKSTRPEIADGDESFDAGDGDPAADPDVVHVAAPPADEKGNVSISALLSAQREVDARANGGRSLEQQGAEAFQTLPMDSQQKMAAAFAGLRDGLSRAFAELQERNGPEYAITKDDIADIMRTMHAR